VTRDVAARRLPAPSPSQPEEASPTAAAAQLREFERAVAENFRWNARANLVYGLFGTTGLRLIMAPTLVPDYVHKLGGTNLAVGVALVVGGLCRLVGPLVSSTLVAHRHRVKPHAIVIGTMMRVAILGIALSALLLPSRWNLGLFVALLGAFYFFDGMQSVAYSIVMGKIIPLARRGRFIGLRDLLGGTTVALISLLIGRLLDDVAFPQSYGYMYLIAFAFMVAGLLCFALTREPAPPWTPQARSLRETLQQIPVLLRADRDFKNYCLCRALGSAALMATPFFILYTQESLAVSGTVLGRLTFLFFLSQTATNPLWGRIADGAGFRMVALVSGTLWMLGALTLLTLPHDMLVASAVFVLAGAGQGGFRMATANMVFEFGLDAEFAHRVATVNVIGELAAALAPLGAGLLADHTGHPAVLLVALALMLAAQVVMAVGVHPPEGGRAERPAA
jgi:MFS family permease